MLTGNIINSDSILETYNNMVLLEAFILYSNEVMHRSEI